MCCRSRVICAACAGSSGPWFMRAERCYLMPGDSPMGYRLPLDSQPWVTRTDYPYVHTPDPMQRFAPLPRYAQVRHQLREGAPRCNGSDHCACCECACCECACASCRRVRWLDHAHRAVRRAAHGVLYVFMPPLERAEDYLELVAAVEATAARLGSAGDARGLRAAARSAAESVSRHARSGRHRSQRPALAQLGGAGRAHHLPVRGGARVAAGHREIHARRPPHRHRRRQSLRARRRDAAGLAVPAPARPAGEPAGLLAQPSVAVVSVLGSVHRSDLAGAAGR